MRVLWISNYRESTGWGRAGADYIKALNSVGVELVTKPIYLGGPKNKIDNKIHEIEKGNGKCDILILHSLPSYFSYSGNFLNIGLYASETSDFTWSGWADRLNMMDHVVVINNQMVGAAKKSGVKKPISVVPHALDTSRFEKSYSLLPSLAKYKERGEFLFYFIGEMTARKGLYRLLKAFHLEFDPSEPVRLVIKTGKPGANPEELANAVRKHSEEIRKGLKINHYKEEVVLTHEISDENICSLHNSCDCFVCPSFGEAWSYPTIDAMSFGRTPIATKCTGFLDYLSNREGWLVDCYEEPVFGVNDTIEGLFVGSETWQSISIPHLRKSMREAYENKQLRQEKAKAGIARAYDFSYEIVGDLFRKTLQNALERRT